MLKKYATIKDLIKANEEDNNEKSSVKKNFIIKS